MWKIVQKKRRLKSESNTENRKYANINETEKKKHVSVQ